MTDFDYRPQIERELGRGAEMRALLESFAGRAATAAARTAPRRTGHYAASIAASVGVDDSGLTIGRVSTADIAGHIIEFGSVNNPPYAPLRRGVEAAGLRVTDSRRRG